MSLHKSLKRKINFGRNNVLSKIEKIKYLIKNGLWKDGDKVTGLPKEKVVKQKKLKTEKKEVKEPTTEWDKLRK